MRLTSDLVADGHEIRRARIEEGTALPLDPFLGQLFHLHIPGQISKVFYFDGTQWICSVTSLNGRQGDVTLSNTDVGLSNVENVRQLPYNEFLKKFGDDLLLTETSATAFPRYIQQSHDGTFDFVSTISMSTVEGVLDLTGATDAVNNDIIQKKNGIWENRTPSQYKVDLGLDQVNNTLDTDKPVSTAQAAAIAAEATARANADTSLEGRIALEESNRVTAVTNEAAARIAADATLQPLDSDLTAIAALNPPDNDFLQRKAGAWINRTVAQVKTDLNLVADTSAALTTEANARIAADAAEVTARTNADNTLTTRIAAEETARANADNTLTTRVAAEETTRANAVTAEATARTNADNTLQANINAAVTARVNADAVLQADINTRVLRAGDTMTGHLAVPTFSKSGVVGEKSIFSSFTADTANQKRDLYFTVPAGKTMSGYIDVHILGAGAIPGVVIKRYSVGITGSTSTLNFSRYAEVLGHTPLNIALSDLAWDAANNRWRIQIAHRTNTLANFAVVVQIFCGEEGNDIKNVLPLVDVGDTYTTDTTVLPEPIVWFERLFISQGSTSSFNVPPTASYTVTSNDSIILAQSGATVLLPGAQDAGVGRAYIVKNIGTSGVTVGVIAGGGQIDAAATMSIGNRSYATFMSDGVNWWRVS